MIATDMLLPATGLGPVVYGVVALGAGCIYVGKKLKNFSKRK